MYVTAQVHWSADSTEDPEHSKEVISKISGDNQQNVEGKGGAEDTKMVEQTVMVLQHKLEEMEKTMGRLIEICGTQNNRNQAIVQKEEVGRDQMDARIETQVSSMEIVTIPPRTEVRYLGKVKHTLNGDVVVCEPVEIGNRQVHVACAIINNMDVIPVRIINFSETEVKIEKGKKIGMAISRIVDPEHLENGTTIGQVDISNDRWIEVGFELLHLGNETRAEVCQLLHQYADLLWKKMVSLPVRRKLSII